jgi:hypothetical protein
MAFYNFNVEINDFPRINIQCNWHTDTSSDPIITDSILIILVIHVFDHSLVFRVKIQNAVCIKFDHLRMSIVFLETYRGM